MSQHKRVAVMLSGCGVQDGSELHEAVVTMLSLQRAGVKTICYAPNIEQTRVVNHLTGEEVAEKRNVLVESARVARGQVKDLATLKASEVDGLAMPGGYGAALNLSNFAKAGAAAKVDAQVERVLEELHAAKKPILALCIAPATVAKVLGRHKVTLTIGDDAGTAAEVEKTGARHKVCGVLEHVVDADHRLVSSPAYNVQATLPEVASGIEGAVKAFVAML